MRERALRYLRNGIVAGGLALGSLSAVASPAIAESRTDIAPITENNPAAIEHNLNLTIQDQKLLTLGISTATLISIFGILVYLDRHRDE